MRIGAAEASVARRKIGALALALGCMLLAPAGAHASSGFGELTRFGARSEQGKSVAKAAAAGTIAGLRVGAETEEPPNLAIGVDPAESNSVFVLDEPVEPRVLKKAHELFEVERHVRIQKFSATGNFEAATKTFTITSPLKEEEEAVSEEEAFSNIAVNASAGVLYVLAEEPRSSEREKDYEAPAAYRLYAFKTAASGSELVPAAGAGSEGVLAGPVELGAESEETGQALLEPRGIAVDPATGQVIVLAHEDTAGTPGDASPNDRFVLERISGKGAPGERWSDQSGFFRSDSVGHGEPDSPVVSAEHVLVRFDGIAEVPYKFSSKAAPVQLMSAAQHVRAVLLEGPEHESGGGLALSPQGVLWEPALVVHELGGAAQEAFTAADARSAASGAELGFSGGQSPLVNKADQCVLEPGVEEEPVELAAGSKEELFVLAPEYLRASEPFFTPANHLAVLALGPGGSGCPAAAGSPPMLTEGGVAVPAGQALLVGAHVQLEEQLSGADADAAEWTIENEATHERVVEKPNPLEFGLASGDALLTEPVLSRTFGQTGTFLVSALVSSDDLETPAIEARPALEVVVDAKPLLTHQPEPVTASEGERASFQAQASGAPAPSVRWEEEPAGSEAWQPIAGAEGDELSFEHVKLAQNGTRLRARFENTINGVGQSATSEAAELTVLANPKEAPQVSSQPLSVTVHEPESASFTARATGAPTPSVQWEVSTDHGIKFSPDTSDPGNETEQLTVQPTQLAQSGREYRARFENVLSSVTSSAAALTVKAAKEAPKIVRQPLAKTVTERENVTFLAEASGFPAPQVQWELSTNAGKSYSADTADSGAQTGQLTIESVALADSGRKYRARFESTAGKVLSSAVTLTVKARQAPKVTKQPASVAVSEPKAATFVAEAAGAPAPAVQWEVSTNGGGSYAPDTSDTGNATKTLRVQPTSVSISGDKYRARFENASGSATSSAATLTVKKAATAAAAGAGLGRAFAEPVADCPRELACLLLASR